MPCSECYGLPVRCKICNGTGKTATLAGSLPSRCYVCGGCGSTRAGCKKCRDTNRDPMSKEACALLYRMMVDDQAALTIPLDGALYISFLSDCVSVARKRMTEAIMITGCSRRTELDGSFCLIDSGPQKNNIVFVSGFMKSQGASISGFAFFDGKQNYFTSNGEAQIVDRLILSPWSGICSMHEAENNKLQETVMGIPKSVYSKIRIRAESEWPEDYRMQRYHIDEEVKSYKLLHPVDHH